jgi:hypothetical protein
MDGFEDCRDSLRYGRDDRVGETQETLSKVTRGTRRFGTKNGTADLKICHYKEEPRRAA